MGSPEGAHGAPSGACATRREPPLYNDGPGSCSWYGNVHYVGLGVACSVRQGHDGACDRCALHRKFAAFSNNHSCITVIVHRRDTVINYRIRHARSLKHCTSLAESSCTETNSGFWGIARHPGTIVEPRDRHDIYHVLSCFLCRTALDTRRDSETRFRGRQASAGERASAGHIHFHLVDWRAQSGLCRAAVRCCR